MAADRLAICLAAAELAPLAKTGGLGDVSAALGRFLHRKGHDVRQFLPLYSSLDLRGLEPAPMDSLRKIPLRFGDLELRFSVAAVVPDDEQPPLYLIDCPSLYHRDSIYTGDDDDLRFLFFQRAVIETCQRLGWRPDIVHANDWHTALLPLLIKDYYGWDKLFARTKTLLTIHNIAHQGVFPSAAIKRLGLEYQTERFHGDDLRDERINFMKTGILYADALTTVSPTYAREISSGPLGMGLETLLAARRRHLVGILNGVDYSVWDPRHDKLIPFRYSADDLSGKEKNKQALLAGLGLHYDPAAPVVGLVARLAAQKGLELVEEALTELLRRRDLRFAALGSGEPRYEEALKRLQRRFPKRVCFFRGFSEELAHLIEAGSDIFLMPSRFEPCGLNQMYSLRYGTVPIVHRTGGLADSVRLYEPASGEGTGILFDDFSVGALRWALSAAVDLFADREAWRRLMLNGMAEDFSWELQGERYVELYRALAG